MGYHVPVMLDETIKGLDIQPNGVYVDLTFGGGGHSREILAHLGDEGKLFAFDQDEDALKNALLDTRFKLLHQNFRYLYRMMRLEGVTSVDGILADLGVSSYQIDTEERGFSIRFDAELDMRMSKSIKTTAHDVVMNYSESELVRIFSDYGEVRNTKTIAKAIVENRGKVPMSTTMEFIDFLDPYVRGKRNRYLAMVFQALRMEVNEEVKVLEEMLDGALKVLKPGGLLVVMTYHSIEDRIVKRFMKTGNIRGEVIKDDFGVIDRPFKILTKKGVDASEEEQKENPRSRSAKLRIVEKI